MRFPNPPKANPVRPLPVEPGWPLAALAFAVVVIAVAGLPL